SRVACGCIHSGLPSYPCVTVVPRNATQGATNPRRFARPHRFSEPLIPSFENVTDLVYGENPHQRAAYYAEAGARRHLLSRVEQLNGRELSYNNLNDLSAARQLVEEFTLPACVIVKHANPCGVAVAAAIEDAYERALGADPVSAYGGVVVLNRAVSRALGARLAEHFVEVLFAPGYEAEALAALRRKKALRILLSTERRSTPAGERDYRRVLGGGLDGAAPASDAFSPFPDGPQLALDAGVKGIIQPGGSKRDPDVVAAVNAAGATMVFTGRRHFRH